MYWVYVNFFYLIGKSNFFFNNVLLVNQFKINWFINKTKFFFFKSDGFNSLNFSKNNFVLTKYLNYFNKVVYINKTFFKNSNLNLFYKYKNQNFYYFNNFNYVIFKKLTNLLFKINLCKKNFVLLDRSYKSVLPVYNYIFGLKNISLYKNYFFIKHSFLSFKNFFFLYRNFSNIFNIILIIILDYHYFNKQLKLIKNINLPICSLVPLELSANFIDYPFVVFNNFNLEKFLFLNFVVQSFLLSYNFKSYRNKIKYLNIFYNFCQINKTYI